MPHTQHIKFLKIMGLAVITVPGRFWRRVSASKATDRRQKSFDFMEGALWPNNQRKIDYNKVG